MQNFLKKALLFLLLPLAIIFTTDILIRNQNTLYKEKYQGAKKTADSIEVLILGTSHATYGINPKHFDLYAYNIANLDQSIYFDKRITLSLLPDLKNLEYVFISIDYHSLAFSSQFNKDFWSYYGNGVKYKNTNYFFANLSPTLFGYTPKVAYSMIKRRAIKLLKHPDEVIDFYIQTGVNPYKPIEKGFIALEGRDTTIFTQDSFDLLSNAYTQIIDESDEKEEIINDLKDFIEILLTNSITPLLITTPTYREYNEYLNQTYINENIKVGKKIAEKYGVEYWDFHDSDLFEIDDFYDLDHLNRKGANKFSSMLNDSIKERESKLKSSL